MASDGPKLVDTMNLEKMRHQLGRSTPDVMWKDFDRLTVTQEETREWTSNFARMMKYKHGANVKSIEAFQSDLIDMDTNTVRFQIHVRLWDVNKRHRNRITIHPEMMDAPRPQSSYLRENKQRIDPTPYTDPTYLFHQK